MDVLVLGAGPTGLLTGAALAMRGHRVTCVDRDPGPGADGTWSRRGVMQFQHAHGFRPQVTEVLGRRWAAGLGAWQGAGAEPVTIPGPGGAGIPVGYRSRRSTFERGLRAAAGAVEGLSLRSGHIDGLLVEGTTGGATAAITGAATGAVIGAAIDGAPTRADLVIDATGRASRVTRTAAAQIEGSCGMAYVNRTHQLRPGVQAPPLDNPVAAVRVYDGYLVLVFRHEAGHFSTVIVRPSVDRALTLLHQRAAYEAACRAIPVLTEWTHSDASVPTSPVLVGGALRNAYVPQRPLAGLVTVGDATATTTPTRGRGVALAYQQVDALLELLDTGADPRHIGAPLGAWCDENIRPWVSDHIAVDTEAVARWRGVDLDLRRPLTSQAISSAAQVDPRIGPIVAPFNAMTALPSSLSAAAEPLARAIYETGWRPPLPAGPTRDELAALITRAA